MEQQVNTSINLEGLNATEYRMATEKLSVLVIKYSIPTILSMVVSALYNVIDRFWVGKMEGIGANALAGIGICMPIMNVIMGCSMLVGIGSASRISISLGERDRDTADKILGNAFSLATIIAVLFTVIGMLTLRPFLSIVGATSATMPYAVDYMSIIMLGSIAGFYGFALNHPIRAAGNAKRFAITQIIGAVVNIVLDPIFIFVLGLGIRGAAIATVIGQLVSAIWVFAYYSKPDSLLKLRLKNLKIDSKIAFSIFSIGVSPFLMQVAASFISAISNRSLLHYGQIELGNGDLAISAMTIISSIFMLLFMPVLGINQGVQPIIGFNFGARNYVRVRDALKWAIIYSVGLCVIGFTATEIFAKQMVLIFNNEPELVALGVKGARIFLIAIPLIGFQVPSTNFFQAIGRAKIAIFLSLLRQVILLVPAYIILPYFFGLTGVFFAGPFSEIGTATLTVFLLIREFKRLKKTFTT